jgi:hypothetical protein
MGVPLYLIKCVPQNIQKVKQNNLNNFTYIRVTAVKNHTFHKPQNLHNNELVTGNTKMAE